MAFGVSSSEHTAVAFHARPRATKDLDVLIEPTAANARKVLAALRDFFGGAELGYSEQDVTEPRWIIQLGVAPVRIDVMSEIPGFGSFDTAWRGARRCHLRLRACALEPAHECARSTKRGVFCGASRTGRCGQGGTELQMRAAMAEGAPQQFARRPQFSRSKRWARLLTFRVT